MLLSANIYHNANKQTPTKFMQENQKFYCYKDQISRLCDSKLLICTYQAMCLVTKYRNHKHFRAILFYCLTSGFSVFAIFVHSKQTR